MMTDARRKTGWQERSAGELKLLQSPALLAAGLRKHAFTTRVGGGSPAPFDSFNLGRHDAAKAHWDDALLNRQKLCHALDVDFKRLAVPGQVHSDKVVWLTDHDSYKEIDGIATNLSGVPILLHFADCVPIILYAGQAGALAVVHAGWRGTAASIVQNGVDVLIERAGAKPAEIVAAVGPAIGSCCYPTSDEVAHKLQETVVRISNRTRHAQGALIEIRGHKPHPDLGAINAQQLLDRGVEQIDVCDLCTSCNPHMFYSHRQSSGLTGRQGAIACLE